MITEDRPGGSMSLFERQCDNEVLWSAVLLVLDDCTLQLSHNGTYLDLESTLAEQRDELEGFQEDAGIKNFMTPFYIHT
ncbi:hypothetical protein DUI87_08012 [Hirundo rustica rustica]|uniref:FHOD1 N-terminal GTPase-binding domain-containing protein n=1 Tax=Hirundo rustica rustica TaxID=333673 RepID=A0A3M0KRC4_HIRRU|nr:hypothetical protein DUI87_08012 [Hirundo rustica rustica]